METTTKDIKERERTGSRSFGIGQACDMKFAALNRSTKSKYRATAANKLGMRTTIQVT